jgi:coenzyme PQQ precursor peptide PqqA
MTHLSARREFYSTGLILIHFAASLRGEPAYGHLAWTSAPSLSANAIRDIEPCLIYKISKIGLDRAVLEKVSAVGCLMEEAMAWTTPILVEICIGLEINGYLPAEF